MEEFSLIISISTLPNGLFALIKIGSSNPFVISSVNAIFILLSPSISVYQIRDEELLKVEIAGPFTGHPPNYPIIIKYW